MEHHYIVMNIDPIRTRTSIFFTVRYPIDSSHRPCIFSLSLLEASFDPTTDSPHQDGRVARELLRARLYFPVVNSMRKLARVLEIMMVRNSPVLNL